MNTLDDSDLTPFEKLLAIDSEIKDLIELEKVMFNECFELCGAKTDLPPEFYAKAKFRRRDCVVGDLFQMRSTVYRRIK